MQIDKRITLAVQQAIEELDGQQVDFATAHRGLIENLVGLGLRINAIHESESAETLRINMELRRQWQLYQDGRDDSFLHENPAQELISLDPTKAEEVNWRQRWERANGKLFDGRMIALKSDLIWQLISDFPFPFPPFAKYSSMGIREIKRGEAMQLGLVGQKTDVKLGSIERPTGVVW